MNDKNESDFFDKPQNRKLLWKLLIAACGVSLIAELFSHRHPHFGIDVIIGFYGLVGVGSICLIVWVGRAFGKLFKVKEDFYDDDSD